MHRSICHKVIILIENKDSQCLFYCRCEEATEVETHHQQTAATTMGVAEDETPSSLTSHPNPNVNNPNQEGTCPIRILYFVSTE